MKFLNFLSILLIFSFGIFSCGEKKSTANEEATHEHGEHTHDHGSGSHSHVVAFEDGDYNVNAEKSTLHWKGSKIVGDEHFGKLSIKEGKLVVKEGQLSTGSTFVIDMTSITVEDYAADNPKNGKLKGHLENDDFFSVNKFPTATLTLTEVKSGENGALNVTADLTIKGITAPVTFVVQTMSHDGEMHAMSKIEFDRTKYDIKYKSGSVFSDLGDKAIKDNIEVAVNIYAAKKQSV
ncbi:YceI family protein [Flammeovirga yaeyamensis]|uniref:YceI family protein n=1 Tax=Flammeovirga yaeyamensis TaxID=367791 RepID=A0AAX1N3F0_9BACT|nr:YceI family protein [Flammeovirga yaeyamensis]MBB3700847.1 polyisoprenoid-binding protein YceI [Flammeovirga yaeyamensis]NMF37955.1 YceI family protein [Flammeovirga yaeyamensis]QWG00607.1 YceI family protein [Flammeovirga yaeyamensis]